MRVYTSYFQQIRNFDSNVLPMSTAVWDPKWYSNNGKIFIDKRGVINGVKCAFLVPNSTCNNLCRGPENCETRDPSVCEFLKKYREQLDKLNFDDVMHVLEGATRIFNKEDVVLLFYEKFDNKCSEREVVKEWFSQHGVQIIDMEVR